jgi:glycosyltransferase involved in cell wall biosynthesis
MALVATALSRRWTTQMRPLVSVGIPTFNRPDGLAATLANIRRQTYENLEIIVSDNASPDPKVAEICTRSVASDGRVSFFRQPVNRGAKANFEFVLARSSGTFFMWAADDDAWCDTFIERCLAVHLAAKRPLAIVTMEVAYETDHGQYPIFLQGRYFHRETEKTTSYDRIRRAFLGNFDNLVYGLLRREFLIGPDGRDPVTRFLGPSLNEIGLILHLAQKGDFRVIPEAGFRKRARELTCAQARWEEIGGFLPLAGNLRSHIWSMPALAKYHHMAQREIYEAINFLEISKPEKVKLRRLVAYQLWRHFFCLVVRLKRPRTLEE